MSSSRSLRDASRQDPVEAGLDVLARTQEASGAWAGDYGGPLFLLPNLVAGCYIAGIDLEPRVRAGMVRYTRGQQREDGGWGLHVEGPSMVYGTVLNYVALRLLGEPAEDPALSRARDFLLRHGGATRAAPWGKFTLALLNLYEWRGVLPTPPELWLLPRRLPIHPGRMWCHSRMILLPMSWLYGARAQAPLDPLLQRLRGEIFAEPWDHVDWEGSMEQVASTDDLVPATGLFTAVNRLLAVYERRPNAALRRRALDHVLDHVDREDRNTDYICIGPVNKVLNLLCWHFTRPEGPELARHIERLRDYLWEGPDGIKMNGYNSSKLWDTAFAFQAVAATGRSRSARPTLEAAWRYIRANQVLEDTPDHEAYHRHPSVGGWPFSDRAHGWPISDCTAEGLKCALDAERLGLEAPLETRRMEEAVDWILSMQNRDGGWATYEPTRGPVWLERLNPSRVWADIMIDYSYPECTSACVQALVAYRDRDPAFRRNAVARAIRRGRRFLLRSQRPDGAWEGSWGICFTYGTWFGVAGLRAAGVAPGHRAIRRAATLLEDRQLADGGWGERWESCLERRWVPTTEGQAVMTSWALLALVAAGRGDSEAVRRGAELLRARQRADGTWPPEHIAGMFNRTCAIHYDNYLKIFPVWALAACESAPAA